VTRLFAHVVMPASFLGATFLPCLTDGALAQSATARRILPLQLEEQIPVPEVSGPSTKGHDPAQVWAYEAED